MIKVLLQSAVKMHSHETTGSFCNVLPFTLTKLFNNALCKAKKHSYLKF